MKIEKFRGWYFRHRKVTLPEMRHYKFATSMNVVKNKIHFTDFHPTRINGVFLILEEVEENCALKLDVRYKFLNLEDIRWVEHMSNCFLALGGDFNG